MANTESYYSRMKAFHHKLIDEMATDAINQSPTYVGALNSLDETEKDGQNENREPSEGETFIGLVRKAQSEVKRVALNQRTDKDDRKERN